MDEHASTANTELDRVPCLASTGGHKCHEPADHDPPHRCCRCGLEWPDEGFDNPDDDGS